MKWLFIRGLARDSRHWGDFPEEFSAGLGVDVATIDPPGFGSQNGRVSPASVAEIVDDLRDRFIADLRGEDEWSILGISLGGMATLDWISRYPKDFRQAVVINTSAGNLGNAVDRGALTIARAVGTALLRRELTAPGGLERRLLTLSSNRPAAELDPIGEQWARWQVEAGPKRDSVRNQILAATRFRAPDHVATPLLVMTSIGDRMVSYRCSVEIARTLEAPIRMHTTAGHDLPLDDPHWVIEQVSAWQSGRRGASASVD